MCDTRCAPAVHVSQRLWLFLFLCSDIRSYDVMFGKIFIYDRNFLLHHFYFLVYVCVCVCGVAGLRCGSSSVQTAVGDRIKYILHTHGCAKHPLNIHFTPNCSLPFIMPIFPKRYFSRFI